MIDRSHPPGRRVRRRRDDQGVVTAFFAILFVAFIAAVGLVYDGGQIINAYLEAGDLASSAARAGAQALDAAALQDADVEIDPAGARDRANAYLADAGYPNSGQVTVADGQVTVTVTLTTNGHFLLGDGDVQATATAMPTAGVESPRPRS